jgi:hypothetical protein
MGRVIPFVGRLSRPFTVGMLRKALEGVDDSLFILVHATEEDPDGDTEVCAGVYAAEVDATCAEEEPYVFRIFANDSELDMECTSEAVNRK